MFNMWLGSCCSLFVLVALISVLGCVCSLRATQATLTVGNRSKIGSLKLYYIDQQGLTPASLFLERRSQSCTSLVQIDYIMFYYSIIVIIRVLL